MTAPRKSDARKRSARNTGGPKKTQRRVIVTPTMQAQQAARALPDGILRVKAIKLGYYGNERRRVNDIFNVEAKNFQPSWMVKVPTTTRLTRTTGAQELKMRMAEIRDEKRAERTGEILTGRDDVDQSMPDDGDNPLGT